MESERKGSASAKTRYVVPAHVFTAADRVALTLQVPVYTSSNSNSNATPAGRAFRVVRLFLIFRENMVPVCLCYFASHLTRICDLCASLCASKQ